MDDSHNKLTLNMSKSNVIIKNSNKNGKLSKNCYNEVLPIMIVKNAKYFGVTFDESLSFDCHIKNLIKKVIVISWNSSKGKTVFKH